MGKKNVINLLSVGLLLVSMCGTFSLDVNADDSPKSMLFEEDEMEQEDRIYYYWWGNFHQGIAWVGVHLEEGTSLGAIDHEGKMLFRVEDFPMDFTDFSNGYAHLMGEYRDDDSIGEMSVIDTGGNITAHYLLDDNSRILSYGDGYVFMEKYDADFYSAGYTYTIFSPEGNVLQTIETEDEMSQLEYLRYIGKGVFSTIDHVFFSEKNMTKIMPTGFWYNKSYFYEDKAVVGTAICQPNDENGGCSRQIVLMDTEGELEYVDLAPGWEGFISTLALKDNLCFVGNEAGSNAAVYNFDDQSFKIIEQEFGSKIVYPKTPLLFEDGKIALKLEGSDGNYYVAVFDQDLNLLVEPIKASDFAFSEDRLIINDDVNEKALVYDGNGNLLFSVSDKGHDEIWPYSEGVASVNVPSNGNDSHLAKSNDVYGKWCAFGPGARYPGYLDKDGNLLFDEVDLSCTVVIDAFEKY